MHSGMLSKSGGDRLSSHYAFRSILPSIAECQTSPTLHSNSGSTLYLYFFQGPARATLLQTALLSLYTSLVSLSRSTSSSHVNAKILLYLVHWPSLLDNSWSTCQFTQFASFWVVWPADLYFREWIYVLNGSRHCWCILQDDFWYQILFLYV